jgi:glycosyltransferase involved in cell wall biosynthesis
MSAEVPLVSVVIPAYYSARTIGATLTSLLAQTYPNYEVVVVDSSSNDLTAQLISTQFPQVRFAHYPQRLLPYAARKRGVALARGELLAFTDPDSWIPSTWLAELVNAYQELKAPIVGSITSRGKSWREVGIHLASSTNGCPVARFGQLI